MNLSAFMSRLFHRNDDRVKTPTILQMDAAECGAVSLSIILAYYECYLTPSAAREACDVTRDGSKAINIIKAARRLGLDAHGMQLTMETVKYIPAPFIIYWEFNHFLVVEGFSEKRIYLNDPATGPRTVTYDEFDKSFTGVAMVLTPGPDFKKIGEPEPPILKVLWDYLKSSRISFIYILLMALALMFPTFALSFFAEIFVDDILIQHQTGWIINLLLCMLLTGIIIGVLTWFKRYYLIRLYMKLKLVGSTDFFWHLLSLPLNFFQQRSPGDIVGRIEAYNRIATILANNIIDNLVGLITLFFFGIVLVLLNWQLAVITFFISILNAYLLWFISRQVSDAGRRFAQNEGKLGGIEMNGIQIIETIKANAVEDNFFNHWAAHHAKKVNSQQQIEVYAAVLRIVSLFLQGLNTLIILCLGSWFIIHGELTIGTLLAIQILVVGFNGPLLNLLNLGEDLYKLKGDLARVNDVNKHEPEEILSDKTETDLLKKNDKPMLELRAIKFGYSKLEPPIFNDLSIKINPGERIAIIGPSGGGKSSLSRLVCGLFAPWSGEILICGHPLKVISRAEYAKFIGLVDQNIFLFAASVRDNLTLWNSTIKDSDIMDALKIACIDDVINERGGLDCWIEEGGKNFSGGQVQRLEIARALLIKPQLLVLDEATAALDPLVEKSIYDNLKRQNCTLFIIAHRLSAIRDCDQIIVIKNGQIIQRGRHEQLMQEKGLYQELVSLEIQ